MYVCEKQSCHAKHAVPQIFIYAFDFALISRPFLMRSRMFSRSLSSFNLVMTTFDGWTPMGTDWPDDFSLTTRSMCTMYLRR